MELQLQPTPSSPKLCPSIMRAPINGTSFAAINDLTDQPVTEHSHYTDPFMQQSSSSEQENSALLTSRHHPFSRNCRSLYTSFFYTNTNTILSKFVMSYEEQLQKAIMKSNLELGRELLLNHKCDLSVMHDKRLPLSVACECNFYEMAELLIKRGANVNQFDFHDQTPLIYAVRFADVQVVQLLVRSGADVNICDASGMHPLHHAIVRQHDDICDYLLQQPTCFIDVRDKEGCTPLATAISKNYMCMIDRLLTAHAQVNIGDNNDDTPLIKAIWSTMSERITQTQLLCLIERLLDAGADINAVNLMQRTALFTAIFQNNTDIALLLIGRGANCHIDDAVVSNFTLLHYACYQGNYTLARALLERHCDPNSVSANGETPIYIAVTKGYLDIVDLLVEYHVNVNLFIGVDNKCTALQASVYFMSNFTQFKQIVDKLIEGGADLSIAIPGPIICICLQYNKYQFAKYLLAVGANIEQRTIFNQSCFYKAFLAKNFEFLQLCVMAGFRLYNETWISNYLDNPDFIEYTDYYVKKATIDTYTSDVQSDTGVLDEHNVSQLGGKTDQEISDLLNMDEYLLERFHSNRISRSSAENNAKRVHQIYSFIKHVYRNPRSLKELARIKIRQHLITIDHKMKFKVENDLPLPKRIKDYLLFKEYDI